MHYFLEKSDICAKNALFFFSPTFRECQFYQRRDKNFLQTRRFAAEIRHLETRFAFLDKVYHYIFSLFFKKKFNFFIFFLGCSSKTQKCHFSNRKSAIRKSTVFDTNAPLPSGRALRAHFPPKTLSWPLGGAPRAYFSSFGPFSAPRLVHALRNLSHNAMYLSKQSRR